MKELGDFLWHSFECKRNGKGTGGDWSVVVVDRGGRLLQVTRAGYFHVLDNVDCRQKCPLGFSQELVFLVEDPNRDSFHRESGKGVLERFLVFTEGRERGRDGPRPGVIKGVGEIVGGEDVMLNGIECSPGKGEQR